MTLRLHIDRLVLEGLPFTGAETARLKEALEAELGERLSAEDSARWSSFVVPAIQPNGATVTMNQGPEDIGRQIAGILHGGLGS